MIYKKKESKDETNNLLPKIIKGSSFDNFIMF